MAVVAIGLAVVAAAADRSGRPSGVAAPPAPSPTASASPRASLPSAVPTATTGPTGIATPSATSTARVAPRSTPRVGTASPPVAGRLGAVDALLADRAAAVLDHDESAWMATVTGDATQRQRRIFRTLEELPFARWSYDAVSEGPSLSAKERSELPDGAFRVRTMVRYRLSDYDQADVQRREFFTVIPVDGGWRIARDDDVASDRYDTARDLWDLGPVTVRTGRSSIVVAREGVTGLGSYVKEADQAVEDVSAVWPAGWNKRIVLYVPRRQSEMGAVLDSDGQGLDQIAAVTTGQVDSAGRGTAGNRIVINPATFGSLSRTGRQIVLSHESTHVATRAITPGSMPLWLSEGIADYVGYRPSGIAPTVAAADVLDDVRAGRGPTDLPSNSDFDGDAPNLAASYESAWLACRLISTRYGQDALVAFYRAVGEGVGVDAAFQQELKTTRDAFVRSWRAQLAQLAGT